MSKKNKTKSSGQFNSSSLTVASLLSGPEPSTQNSQKEERELKKVKKSLKSNSFSNFDQFDLLTSSLLDDDDESNKKKSNADKKNGLESPLLFQLNNNQAKKTPSRDAPSLNDLLGPICIDNNDDDDDDDGLNSFPQYQSTLPSFTKKPPISSQQENANEYEYEIIEEEEEEEEKEEEPIKNQATHKGRQQIRLGVIKSSSSGSIDFSELMKNKNKNSSSSRNSNLSYFSDKISSLDSQNSNLEEDKLSFTSSSSLLGSNNIIQLKSNSSSVSSPNLSPPPCTETTHRNHSSSVSSNHSKQQASEQFSNLLNPSDKHEETQKGNRASTLKSTKHVQLIFQNDDPIRRPHNSNANNNLKQKVSFNENKDNDSDNENDNAINLHNSPSLVSDDEED